VAGNQLRSDTAAVAGAELQRRVKDITGRHSTQIISTQILPASEEEGFVRIALRVRLRGVLPDVLRSIYDIETNEVHMFLDNLSLRNNAANLRQQLLVMRPMEAEFDLIAYMPEES
jgi:general secretion pathway protein M